MAELTKQMRWYLDDIELAGQLIVDVGANVGALSQFFFDHGDERTQVLSLEPIPENVEAIRARIDPSDADRWRVERCAVTSATGEVTLRREFTDEDGHNSMVTTGPAGPNVLTAPGKRLHELAPNANVVKLDVEGHEYEILDDSLGAMGDVHTWAIEFHLVEGRPLQTALAALDRHGFAVYAATQKPGDKSGGWHSAKIPVSLQWAQIPVAKTRADGSVFKMLHVLGKRPRSGV